MENMKIIQQKNFPPKETFKEQIAYQFSESKEHRDFILVMISEHSIPENSKIEEYFKNVSQNSTRRIKTRCQQPTGTL